MDLNQKTKEWYTSYYKNNADRNDLRSNPQVLFQVLAMEASIVNGMRFVNQDPSCAKVLDVGCGSGANYFQLLRLNYKIHNFTGIDIIEERLAMAKDTYPNANFILEDASKMQFENNTFDLVYESTLFATLPDDELCKSIASEMIRVCKVGGYILLVDWRIKKISNPNYNALSKKKLMKLFRTDKCTELIVTRHGALVPPVGRFLSKYISSVYFIVARIFPFLVGQVTYVLQKKEEFKKDMAGNKNQSYNFYSREVEDSNISYGSKNLSIWKPSLKSFIIPGMNRKFVFWWFLHYLNIFPTRDYSVVYIKKDNKIIHRSCVVPKFFRWPFMGRNDLQVTATWTHPDFRGKGLATIALEFIIVEYSNKNRKIWYVCRPENLPSVKVCLKNGFKLVGQGERKNFLGLRFLGTFRILSDSSVEKIQYDGHS